MNTLFSFASGADLSTTSQYSRLQKFYKLDNQIKERYEQISNDYLSGKEVTLYNKHIDSKPYKVKQWPPSRDLELALMITRAKYILRSLDLIN